MLAALGKADFGVCGVVGGMTVIERMRGNARRRIGGGNGKIHGKGMTVSISSDPFSPVRRDHRLVGVRRGTDKARTRGVPPRAQVIATGGLRRRPQAVRAPTPEGISKMNDFFTMGSDPIVFHFVMELMNQGIFKQDFCERMICKD